MLKLLSPIWWLKKLATLAVVIGLFVWLAPPEYVEKAQSGTVSFLRGSASTIESVQLPRIEPPDFIRDVQASELPVDINTGTESNGDTSDAAAKERVDEAVEAIEDAVPENPQAAAAGTKVPGHVQRVVDGDTVIYAPENRPDTTFRIRLTIIDAPEICQPFGKRSDRTLKKLVRGKRLHAQIKGHDHYGRPLGALFHGSTNLNLVMLDRGMAWHNTKYSSDPRADAIQAAARFKSVGLWQQKNPVPPWEFRKDNKCSREDYR